MAIAIPQFVSPFVENETTVRARLQAAVPDVLAGTDPGTWSNDWLEINVAETVLKWNQLGQILAQCFVSWATGQQLDAHALSYGLRRGAGSAALGTERFTAPPGTAIAPGVLVEAPQNDPNLPRLRYQTINIASMLVPATGAYVDVPVQAIDVGLEFNQPPGQITLLDTAVPGVTAVTNPFPVVQGIDPENDDSLRQRALAQAQLPTGSGTTLDYQVWGLEVPGVGDVAVYPQWDLSGRTPGVVDGRQNGSVELILRDPLLSPVDWSIVQATQKHIDPSRQMLAMFEAAEGWVSSGAGTMTFDDAVGVEAGANALSLAFTVAGIGVVTLTRLMDLSRFAAADDVYLWVHSNDWSKIVNIGSSIVLSTDPGDYFTALMSTVSPGGTTHPSSGSGWWLWRISKSQFTATGAPNWASLTTVAVNVDVSGACTVHLDYMSERVNAGAVGAGGRSPVGADVTVTTPVLLPIAITISNSLLAPGFTLVDSPGNTNAVTLLAQNLVTFFQGLAPGQNVRFVDIARAVHDSPGFLDFALSLPAASGSPAAISISPHQYATLGALTVS